MQRNFLVFPLPIEMLCLVIKIFTLKDSLVQWSLCYWSPELSGRLHIAVKEQKSQISSHTNACVVVCNDRSTV